MSVFVNGLVGSNAAHRNIPPVRGVTVTPLPTTQPPTTKKIDGADHEVVASYSELYEEGEVEISVFLLNSQLRNDLHSPGGVASLPTTIKAPQFLNSLQPRPLNLLLILHGLFTCCIPAT